jgi:hypothetical protein
MKKAFDLGRSISTLTTMLMSKKHTKEGILSLAMARAKTTLEGENDINYETLLLEYVNHPEIYLILEKLQELYNF